MRVLDYTNYLCWWCCAQLLGVVSIPECWAVFVKIVLTIAGEKSHMYQLSMWCVREVNIKGVHVKWYFMFISVLIEFLVGRPRCIFWDHPINVEDKNWKSELWFCESRMDCPRCISRGRPPKVEYTKWISELRLSIDLLYGAVCQTVRNLNLLMRFNNKNTCLYRSL